MCGDLSVGYVRLVIILPVDLKPQLEVTCCDRKGNMWVARAHPMVLCSNSLNDKNSFGGSVCEQ